MNRSATPWLEVTITVGDEVVHRSRLDVRDGVDPEALVEKHWGLVAEAWKSDTPVVIELADPDGLAPPLRLSNDPTKLEQPIAMGTEEADSEVERRWPLP